MENKYQRLFGDLRYRMASYEKAKPYLFVRLLNYPGNKKELEDKVFRTTGDIAQVLYLQVGEDDEKLHSTKLYRETIKTWGKDPEMVMEEALNNTLRLYPPRLFIWQRLLTETGYEGEEFMNRGCSLLTEEPVGNCISTRNLVNGAVAAFLPGVARRLAELMQSDLLLAFTSVHEVMVHSEKTTDLDQLSDVLKDTIRAATPSEDFLSDQIYHYSRELGIFSMLDTNAVVS